MAHPALRNIGVVAHIDAGKTTVSERILFFSGVERRMGEVHEGTATLDWMEEERRRGITITAAATRVPWRGHQINLIDTPGHVDFTVEVERCMRVLDGAILVLNAVAGVQAQTETVWRQLRQNHVACIALVNQYDRAGADYLGAIQGMRERLGAPAVPVQFPLGQGRDFRAVVDLLTLEAWEFPAGEERGTPVRIETPAEVLDEVGVLHAELVESLAEEDEELLAAFSEDREPPVDALRRALRARVLARTLVPVFCGAALRNVGITPLLDGVVDYLPAPEEAPMVQGTDLATGQRASFAADPDAPLCSLAFKLAADPHEDLVFTRIYAGTLRPSDKVWNPRVKRMERVSRILAMHADVRRPLEEAGPGEIVALTGLKLTATGDTLCSRAAPMALESLTFPEPVISRVLEPRATDDRDRLRQALERLAFEDPSFHVREDEDTGQWLIEGMGELHLEVKEHLLKELYRLEVNAGQPRVAYREAVTSAGEGEGRVDRTLGAHRVFGAVALEISPLEGALGAEGETPRGHAFDWDEERPVPVALRPALAESLVLGLSVGPRFGFPMAPARLRVSCLESSADKDAELGLDQAAHLALRNALAKAGVTLLEPLMSFEIEAPAEFMSGILGELNAKRAEIADLRAEGESRRVVGTVSLAQMFGYATTLRSLSQGRAEFTLEPAGFRQVPEGELEARGLSWT